MERAAWTNERLDDLAEAMRTGFTRADQDIRDVREEIRGTRGELREEIRGTRGELREEIRATRAELTAQIDALRQTTIRIGGGMLLGFISVLAAILARGA
jgi:hypothetical protein